ATSSLDGTTRLWDLAQISPGEWSGAVGHAGETVLDFSPTGPFLASGGQEGELRYWNVENGNELFRLKNEEGGITSLEINQSGSQAAVGFESGRVLLVDLPSGRGADSLDGGQIIASISFSPDGDLVAAGTGDGSLWIWETDTGVNLGVWELSDGFINGLAFSPDSEQLAAVSFTGDGQILDVNELLAPDIEILQIISKDAVAVDFDSPTMPFTSVAWSPDGGRLVTTSWEGDLVIWDSKSGENISLVGGHQGQVREAEFSPDGARISSVGPDGSLIIWDAQTGERQYVLDEVEGGLRTLSFSPDGRYLATGGTDGSVRVYVMPLEELMELARARLTRGLSEEECHRYLHLDGCPQGSES
ncbi:MAG: WD40 repeat domain-containing protein, partial [Anaerolineales bacterium]|nr:WD40 repeat domain-containing protein [Anaerolineales bacterium]